MQHNFPHLNGSIPGHPGTGREVYEQIEGAFDYTLWREGATLTLMSVPWGVYAPEVMTDRPGFDTVEERDAWFAKHVAASLERGGSAVESHRLASRVRYQIHSSVELPFTFDYASRYNYLIVDYPDAPLPYGSNGIKRWFYHVTDIAYNSPSSTTVTLVPDWWTTVAPLLTINHMVLERGHAPVAATSVEDYLKAPLANSEYLLAPDEDYGTRSLVAKHADLVFNTGAMWAVICLRGVPITGAFAGYVMPFDNSTLIDGIPSDYQFAVPASQLGAFLDAWQANAAQSMRALDALYMVGERLISFDADANIFGIACKVGAHGNAGTLSVALAKTDFGYAANIADLAKLYTYPYAHIEVSDERGNVTEVRVEDLSAGSVDVEYALNAAFPWLTVSAHVAGVGGSRTALAFSTATEHSFGAGGRWYATLMSWGVPCFQVHQSAAQAYDYATHWDRVQRAADAATAYANVTASNATAYDNTVAGNATMYANTDNSASNATANNAVAVAASTATTARSIEGNNGCVVWQNAKMKNDTSADIAMSSAQYAADKDGLAVAATNNQAQGVASAATSILSATMGAAGLAAATGVGIPAAIAIGSVGGVATAAVNIAATQASNTVSQSNNTDVYLAAINNAGTKRDNATDYSTSSTNTSNAVIKDNTATNNQANTTVTANNAALMRTNAKNSQTTGDANAGRSRDTGDANAERSRDNALAAIENSIKNAAMGAPSSYGASANGEFATTRPMLLSVNVVTESRSAIRQAATQFKRYGYALNQAWEFETWNVMKNFSYWKVSDIWATGVDTVPEEGQDAVRRMLYDGVTVWRDPDKIGTVSIYDN